MITRQILALTVISTAVAMAAAAAAVTAADLPTRKPGLWEITRSSGNPKIPPTVQRVCLDAATDQLLYKVGAGASQKLCSKVDVSSTGGKVIIESQCQLGSSKSSSRSVTIMSGDSAYHTDVTTHYDPPMYGESGLTFTQDAKWIGSCPADMKPGDLVVEPSAIMPTPMRMNLNDMFKGSQ